MAFFTVSPGHPFVTVHWDGATLGEANEGTCDHFYGQELQVVLVDSAGRVLDRRPLAYHDLLPINSPLPSVTFARIPRPANGELGVLLQWANLACQGGPGWVRDEPAIATLSASRVTAQCN